MNRKVRSLFIAGLFALGVSASGVAAVAAHAAPKTGAAIKAAQPAQVSDADTLQQGQTGVTGESVNDNKDDAQQGQTGQTGESVNDNKDQKDSGNQNAAQQGQAGDQL